MSLTPKQKKYLGYGAALVVGLSLLKRKMAEQIAAVQVADANAQVEHQQAINDAVATATAPAPAVAGLAELDGLGYDARQQILRSGGYRQRLQAANVLAGLQGAHHAPGRVFQKDMHEPWNRVAFDSSLNYPNLDGRLAGAGYSSALPGMGSSSALPGMGLVNKLGTMVSNALPGMGDDGPGSPVSVATATNQTLTTMTNAIGLLSGSIIVGGVVWAMRKKKIA